MIFGEEEKKGNFSVKSALSFLRVTFTKILKGTL